MRASVVLSLVIGVVIGFMAGGFAPRSELSALRKEHAELKDRLASREQSDLFGGFLPRLAAGARSGSDLRAPSPASSAVTGVSAGPEPTQGERRDAEQLEGGLSELEAFETAQAVRATASRQALIEQADLNEAQQQRLDAALDGLQQQLLDMSGRAALQLVRLPEPEPREMLALAHDISGVMLSGQEALDGVIVETGTPTSELDEKARQVWNHLRLDGLSERMRAALQQVKASRQPTAGIPTVE